MSEGNCLLFRLPYELRYQIFREAMGIYPSLGINFVFHAPVQTAEWREEMKQQNAWRYGSQKSKKHPCTISFPTVGRKPPLPLLLVSHRFTADVLAVLSDAINHDLAVVKLSIAGPTLYNQYINPIAITPKFLSCVSAGRFVFAGYAVNTVRTVFADAEDSMGCLPKSVRNAVTSVYFTKALLMRNLSGCLLNKAARQTLPPGREWSDNVALAVLSKLPAVKAVAISVPFGGDDAEDKNYLQLPGRMIFEMLERGALQALEVVYEAGDPNALNWGSEDVHKRYKEWGRLTGRWEAPRSYPNVVQSPSAATWEQWWACSGWRVVRVDDAELDRRGRYVRPLEYGSMLNQGVVEESVVWRIQRV
ncbi:hypothetical protein TWF281_005321 [Arthrobotrys megalospora]